MNETLRAVPAAPPHGRRRTYAAAILTLVATALTLTASAAQARVDTSAANGLVAAYSFDEGTGSTVADASGSGNTGTTSNTAWSAAGRYGGALSFNGTNALVTVPDSASLDLSAGMTLEAWVKPSASMASAWKAVLVKEQPSELVYGLYANSQRNVPAGVVFRGAEKTAYGTTQSAASAWHFLTATYDATTIRIYLDGTLVGSKPASGNMIASTGALRIGGDSIWNEWFQGQIDNVRVYNFPLAAGAIQSDMATPIGAPTDTQPPSTPTALTATGATMTSVSLNWAPSSDNVGITGYTVYRNGTSAGTTGATTYNASGLTCGTTYTFAVDAYDAAGNRSAKTQVNSSTAACTDTAPPSMPASLTTSAVTPSSVTLSWAASSDNTGVVGYSAFKNVALQGTTGSTSYSFSGLACGTSYTLAVDAYDASGNHSLAASLLATTSPCTDTTAPSTPGSPTASGATQNSLTFSWAASTDNTAVAGYGAYKNAALQGTTGTTSYTFSGLTCGTSYTLAVDAFDAAGNRSAKAALSASTSACTTGTSTLGNVFMSPSGSDSGANCRRFATPVSNPGGAVCLTIARAYNLASKGDTVVMAGGTYGGQLRSSDAVAKGTTGGGCDRYASDIAGCINFVPDSGASVSWSPGAEIRIEVPYVHLKGLTIPPNPHGDVYAGVNDTSTNIKGIWLDSVDIPQFFATNLDGFAITDSRVGPCVTSTSYTTCDSQIKGGYLAPDAPGLEHDILIDNVTFHDTWRTGSQDHLECLLVFDAKNITVRNSAFQNCGIIDFFLASTSGHPLSNALVENTVFDRPGSHAPTSPSNQTSSGIMLSCQASTCSNITVRNNSFVAGAQMITQNPGGSFVGTVTYTGNASGGSTICEGFTTYTYNVFNGSSCGSNSINANPGFLSPTTNPVDLHVGTASPVSGRGNPANAPTNDHDGRTRPTPDAAGAYENR